MSGKPASVNTTTAKAPAAKASAKATKAAAAAPKVEAAAVAAAVAPKVEVAKAAKATKAGAKATAAAATAPAAVAAKANGSSKAVAVAVAATPADGKAEVDEAGKKRVQMASVLNISISQARCAAWLKKELSDGDNETQLAALRAELKTAGTDQKKVDELKAKIAALSKKSVRLSSDTPIAAAVVMDAVVIELVRHAMDQAIASDRKIVDVAHVHEGNPSSLVYYPIFSKLPSYVGYSPEHEKELHEKQAAINKAVKEAREAKKNGAADAKAAPQGDEEGEHTKTTFTTYVENALKTIKEEETYAAMRISNRMREYLSDLIIEGLARLAMLSRIIVQGVMVVRTMNADHVKAIIHLLMADEGRTEEQIDAVKAHIDEKLEVYHSHLKSEKEKKADAMTDEEKAKKAEAENARKLKSVELAKTRADAAAAKAALLAKEIEAKA